MCVYVCAIQKHLEDQNVKIWACFSSGDVYTLWLLIKTETNIEIAILAIRGIKSLRKNSVYELHLCLLWAKSYCLNCPISIYNNNLNVKKSRAAYTLHWDVCLYISEIRNKRM